MRLGTWITAPHPSVVDLLARQDFEWLCVDLEHSPVSRLELQTALNLIQAQGKKAFVRVAQNSHTEIKFPLDAGADGIVVPMVNSAAEARAAISHCLYPPFGQRGVGLARAQGYGFNFDDHLERNKSLEIIVQVEHINAVKEIDEILKIERLSGIFVGPYDLSGSMGIAGQFDHPLMVEAVSLVAEKTRRAGKVLGMHVITPDYKQVLHKRDLGYNFIAFSVDTFFMGQMVRDSLKSLKEANKL